MTRIEERRSRDFRCKQVPFARTALRNLFVFDVSGVLGLEFGIQKVEISAVEKVDFVSIC